MDTNDDARKNLLDKYTKPAYPKLVKPDPAATNDEEEDNGNGVYAALVKTREKKASTPRFRIVDRNGQMFGCGYAYLLGWMFSPPETLSIYTTTHAFILTGRNLSVIEKALLREKVEQLREFNPDKDTLPPEGEPLILSMIIDNRLAP